MTKFQFVSDVLSIINGLLEAGINGCHNHEARTQLDHLFDQFEEHEGTPTDVTHSPADLEMYAYIIDNVHQRGYDYWLERQTPKMKQKDLATILDDMAVKEAAMPKDLKEYFEIVENLEHGYVMLIDESEGNFLDDSEYSDHCDCGVVTDEAV